MALIHRFDDVARSLPDQLALLSSGGTRTFAELRGEVEAVARRLRSLGVADAQPVGIAAPRSIESMIAVLGTLRAGGIYVPIDPNYPIARQRSIAADANVAALLVASSLAPLPEWAGTTPIVDLSGPAAGSVYLDALPLPDTKPDDGLNILYTSGSTGRPKGVCGTQAAMLNRLEWSWASFPFGEHEVVGHRSSLNFVDAGPEMFSGLLRGVPTAILLPEELTDLGRFVDALERHGVTRVTVVPSILAAMLRSVPELGDRLARLRIWITSGEELKLPLLRAFRAALPHATLINLYGTTEVTGDVTAAVFEPNTPAPRERVPIGSAIADAELLILDADGQPVADGQPGELYVAGPVLARGYHHRPQEEGVRFPWHPTRPRERTFRTGDQVRREPDGALVYLGRVDNLVKIRGIRIELEEIDRCLLGACAGLQDIAAVLEGGDRLVAFVCPLDVDVDALHQVAVEQLPEVMVPSRFIPIAALPLQPNGKVDRRSLATLVHVTARAIEPERRPQTPTELELARIWAGLLRRQDIARDDSFAALGGDSLSLAELLAALEASHGRRLELGLARSGTLEAVARVLDGHELGHGHDDASFTAGPTIGDRVTLSPMGAIGADDPSVIALLIEASHDSALCWATELPPRMDEARARAYCLASDGMIVRLDGEPVGAGLVQRCPNIGEGVEVPADGVQLDEWLLGRARGLGILGEAGAWPLLRDWLAERFDTDVAVVWEDHLAMLAILRARGYTRAGRSFWTSKPDGDGSSGWCEVWTYDLRPHAP